MAREGRKKEEGSTMVVPPASQVLQLASADQARCSKVLRIAGQS